MSYPTAAQFHAAVALLRAFPPNPLAAAHPLVAEAERLARAALTQAGWTGATSECPPYGALGEKGQAQIEHLGAMIERTAEVNAMLESFILLVTEVPEMEDSAQAHDALQRLRIQARLLMHNAGLVAQGLPPVDQLPEGA